MSTQSAGCSLTPKDGRIDWNNNQHCEYCRRDFEIKNMEGLLMFLKTQPGGSAGAKVLTSRGFVPIEETEAFQAIRARNIPQDEKKQSSI